VSPDRKNAHIVLFLSFRLFDSKSCEVLPCCIYSLADLAVILVPREIIPIPRIPPCVNSSGHVMATCDPGLTSPTVKGDMSMFPVTISGVVDTFEGTPPLPNDSASGNEPQLEINLSSLDSSSNAGTPHSCHQRNKDGRKASTNTHVQHSKSFPKDSVHSDSHKGGLCSEPDDNRASCPDISNLTAVPHLASPKWKKRRHRGRHRHDHSMTTGSPSHDFGLQLPSPRTDANCCTVIPSASPLHATDSADLSKSAPCDTWSLMGIITDPMSWGPESSSTERVASPPFKVCSSVSSDLTPSKDQRRSTGSSWCSQALPFFSVSLSGDDDVTQVQCLFF